MSGCIINCMSNCRKWCIDHDLTDRFCAKWARLFIAALKLYMNMTDIFSCRNLILHERIFIKSSLCIISDILRQCHSDSLKDSALSLNSCQVWVHRSPTVNSSIIIDHFCLSGQKIYFRGLDDPLKVTSITVDVGQLCFLWLEEAYEVTREEDFDMLDESIRGESAPGLFKQITITFNPWNEHHWLKKRFFDAPPDPDILAMTTNYTCNEWLDDADKRLFERMRQNNPRRYRVAGLGDWGIVDGLIFENWEEREFDIDELRRRPELHTVFGLDFGYTNDPTALFCGMIDRVSRTLYVFDEMYEKGMSNERIAEHVAAMGYAKERITADSAEPKSIDRLRELGLYRIRAARKGKDSIANGIDFLQDYRIIVHPRCVHFITEISNYTWDTDRFGNKIGRPIDDFNHLMDAMRYACEGDMRGATFSFD